MAEGEGALGETLKMRSMDDSGRKSVVVSVVKPKDVVLSMDPRGDALLNFQTTGNAVVSLLLSMAALEELETMVAEARLAEARNHSRH